MQPAFRSTTSAIGYSILLAVLLMLPLVTSWVGHPPREQAYAALSEEAGPIGMHVQVLFHDQENVDVLLLGSSLIRYGIDVPTMEAYMRARLGRPVHVRILAMNWQGMDMEYFLLRDYLSLHHPSLILWNTPVPGARHLEPHVEAFRWVRFGEFSDSLEGLPARYRLALYGDMVLGAPREMLTHLRSNKVAYNKLRLYSSMLEAGYYGAPEAGYYGAPYIRESVDGFAPPALSSTYQLAPYALIRQTGKPLDAYESHFAGKILSLAAEKQIRVALLHIPIDSERDLNYMPERSTFKGQVYPDTPFLGVTSSVLFGTMDDARFRHYYLDQHFNRNGQLLFTKAILPAVMKAYSGAGKNYE
jgi:hypothetical protein